MKRVLLFLILAALLSAEPPEGFRTATLGKAPMTDWKFFDANNLYCTINSSGPYADYLRTNSSGMFWPKGTTKTSVYTAGLWFIGRHRPTSQLRTAVMDYATEFQPGPILSRYNTTTNSVTAIGDPTNGQYRIYKIGRRSTVIDKDYAEWPGDLGAPYTDRNGNGRWDAGTDTPKLTGDQMLWCVFNDGNPAAHTKVGTTSPMGLEVQASYFGFENYAPLANVMFMRFIVINKSDADYDSVYISLWSDTDLGDANDDLAGYDSTLHLAYVYNYDNSDGGASGYGSRPPAGGFMLIQGPLVPGSSADAGTKGGRTVPGMKNLTPASHVVYFGGGGGVGWNDPALGNTAFAEGAYRYQRGLVGSTGNAYIDPGTSMPTPFVFAGDPVAGTGWTQTMTATAQDVRNMSSVGPFTLAQDDTQEIVAAYVIAQGSDRLESVTKLRETATFARTVADAGFVFPSVKTAQVHSADSVTITMEADVNAYNATALTATVRRYTDDSLLTMTAFHDDGQDGDRMPQDGIFTGAFRFANSPVPVRIDGDLTLSGGGTMRWPSLADRMPLSVVRAIAPVVLSDDRNQDGTVQPGETFRFTVSLQNEHPFGFSYLNVRNNLEYAPSLTVNMLGPSSTESVLYSPNSWTNYLVQTIPSGYPGNHYTEHLTISDGNGNLWSDSVTFPVQRRTEYTATTVKNAGRSPSAIEVVVMDRSKVKDHLYSVSGAESSGVFLGLEVRDSTERRRVGEIIRFYSSSLLSDINQIIPLTDGFKVSISSLQPYSIPSVGVRSKDSASWFTTNVFPPRSLYWITPASTASAGEPGAVRISFSPLDSVMPAQSAGTMISNNRTYWYPQWGSSRRQKAYLYSSTAFLGFIEVPFTVHDVSGALPQQRDVVLLRSNTMATKAWIHGTDRLFIMEAPYSADGSRYDSTKGGINLLPLFGTNGGFPYHYHVTMARRSPPMNDTIDLLIDCVPAFSSRDIFTFRPTDLRVNTGVTPEAAELWPNYPNPFNPSTTIRYSVPATAPTTLSIYDILGRRVRTLVDEVKETGTYDVTWDGRTDAGTPVASGVYLYRLSAGEGVLIKRMMLLK